MSKRNQLTKLLHPDVTREEVQELRLYLSRCSLLLPLSGLYEMTDATSASALWRLPGKYGPLTEEQVEAAMLLVQHDTLAIRVMPLQDLVQGQLVPVLQYALQHGLDPNTYVHPGENRLIWCHGTYQTLRLLLEHGADPNIEPILTRHDANRTSRLLSRRGNKLETVQLLVEYGADPLWINNEGSTHLCFASHDPVVVVFFLNQGVDPCHRDIDGMPAVQYFFMDYFLAPHQQAARNIQKSIEVLIEWCDEHLQDWCGPEEYQFLVKSALRPLLDLSRQRRQRVVEQRMTLAMHNIGCFFPPELVHLVSEYC